MKFVTAIYNNLYGTKYGGRLNRDRHYLYSLKVLLNTNIPFVCYTSEKDFNILKHELKNFDNIEFKIFELSDFHYHKDIQRIKELNKDSYISDAVWEFRSVELMWLKMYWLYEESKMDDKVFWIDAGLSHSGIIPNKFNINNDKNNYIKSFENYKAFDNKFVQKLTSYNKFFSFYCNNRQHSYPIKYRDNDNLLNGSIVAGLMGGNSNYIKEVYTYFVDIIEDIIKCDDLIQEEMALTLIYQYHNELFEVYEFDTWYHEDWECYDSSMISFSKFFEEL